MSLKAIVESLDAVPEALRPFYREGESDATKGKFVLAVEPVDGFALEDVGGLRSAYVSVKDELATAKSALEGFKGLSARSVREKLAELDRLKAFDPESEADKRAQAKMQSTLEDLTNKHKAEIGERDARTQRLMSQVERLLIQDAATSAITKHKGSPALLLPHVASRVKVEEQEDGSFAIKVLESNGKPMIAWRDGRAADATIEDLVLNLKNTPDFGRAFEAAASGSGARGGNGGGGVPAVNPFSKKHFNLTEQSRLYKEDRVQYEHLKKLAEVEG